MKIKDIKKFGLRLYLECSENRFLSWLGSVWNHILPSYRPNCLDKIKWTINPRQKWIKKYVEWNQWCDKVELIPKFLFGCIIHFIEEEDALNLIAWKESSVWHEKVEKELKECYHYIKFDRPALERSLEESYDNLPDSDDYSVKYARVNEIELELTKLDQKYMMWIVANKDYLWI